MLLGRANDNTRTYSDGFGEQYIEDVEYCGLLISEHKYQEAWMLAGTLKQESIPLLFNRAICLYKMHRYENCLQTLNRTMMMLPTMRSIIPAPTGDEINALHELQKNLPTYLIPVSFRYVELFPELLKDSVRRMMVDCWLALGNKAKVTEIGTPLLQKGYHNVIEALHQIDQYDTTPVPNKAKS